MSGMHRFLSRKERKPKVLSPATPPSPVERRASSASAASIVSTAIAIASPSSSSLLPFLIGFWGRHSLRPSSRGLEQQRIGPGQDGAAHARMHKRKESAASTSSSWTASIFDLSFALDGAGSLRRPYRWRRPAFALPAQHIASGPEANSNHFLTLQTISDTGAFGGLFVSEDQDKRRLDKEEDKKIHSILTQLRRYGITHFNEANVAYALRAPGIGDNSDEALRLLLLFEDTYEGLVQPYNPSTKLLGAENRKGVTCYLDALLFAMFARLDSFEAMLYNSYQDLPRKRLAGLMRLWVNMLRNGKLITTDITKHLQDALAECGWKSAADLCQQDTSEAFTFITGQLELPLLTLKMDLFHTGKEEPDDDHRFVNERLLEVAIAAEPSEGNSVITLEDCLEHYFNNRIEVKRHLERNRSFTLPGSKSLDRVPSYRSSAPEKPAAAHVETVEMSDEPAETSTVSTPEAMTPAKSSLDRLRPSLAGRKRADSIFSQRRVINGEEVKSPNGPGGDGDSASTRQRKASVRTEVLMPAWQFFKLLPWYTDNVPTSDAQIAAHFSRKRPVLGIALKRYQVSHQGVASRLDTYVDIPLEIAVPNFVSDDEMQDSSPLVGNFKLVLQSVVCHRGNSVNSGHYVSLVRGQAPNATSRPGTSTTNGSDSEDEPPPDPWMLFDDLAKDRVTYVDIHAKLKDECPYLLFYQVQPIDEDLLMGDPPSYEEATNRVPSHHRTSSPMDRKVMPTLTTENDGDTVIVDEASPTSPNGAIERTTDVADWTDTSARTSLDVSRIFDDASRGRRSMSSVRRSSSFANDDTSLASGSVRGSVPSTPLDEEPGSSTARGFLGLPSRRGSKVSGAKKEKSKSRPGSVGADEQRTSRFGMGLSMSKITSLGRTRSGQDMLALAAQEEKDKERGATTDPASKQPPQQTQPHAPAPSTVAAAAIASSPELGHEKVASRSFGSGSSLEFVSGNESVESFKTDPITGGSATLHAPPPLPPTGAATHQQPGRTADDAAGKKSWREKREERSRIREEKKEEKKAERKGAKGEAQHDHEAGGGHDRGLSLGQTSQHAHHQHKSSKVRKRGGEVPDRECVVM